MPDYRKISLLAVCIATVNIAAARSFDARLDRDRKSADAVPGTTESEAPGESSQESLISDAIIIADFTNSMGEYCVCPAGKERRLAIAQWALYDLLDAIP